jgi:hypothetical protein
MASCTISNELRCSILVSDDGITLNEMGDNWSDASVEVKRDGERYEFEVYRYDDRAHFYADEYQMRELRAWLNKTLKD